MGVVGAHSCMETELSDLEDFYALLRWWLQKLRGKDAFLIITYVSGLAPEMHSVTSANQVLMHSKGSEGFGSTGTWGPSTKQYPSEPETWASVQHRMPVASHGRWSVSSHLAVAKQVRA